MILWCLVHLWCWMWGLGIDKYLAGLCIFLSVIETIVELVLAALAVVQMYNDGLRIGRENGKWWIKWDKEARKSRW